MNSNFHYHFVRFVRMTLVRADWNIGAEPSKLVAVVHATQIGNIIAGYKQPKDNDVAFQLL